MGNVNDGDKKESNSTNSPGQKHPVDRAGWISLATFSWMSHLMYISYKDVLKPEQVPAISEHEETKVNTDVLEQLWMTELQNNPANPRLRRVLWTFVKKRVLITSFVFLTSVILGFLSSVVLLKRVLDFASDPDGSLYEGLIRVGLLIICELLRVFFFTWTWAWSYRTAIRLKTACIGLVTRKIFRLASMDDHYTARLVNVISSDCHRIYDVVVSMQVAIGGPVTLVLGAIYISLELGLIPLIGMLIFPLSYPLQYFLAKGSASQKALSLNWKDARVGYLREALQSLKFLKMFAWEKHFARLISETRKQELTYLFRSQILQSFSIVLSPMLPHIGAIITFILYISSGKDLTPAQAFCIITLYSGRIRPTLNSLRAGFRSYLDSRISLGRIQGFTTLFLFSLFYYATRTISRILDLKQSYIVATTRLQEILALPDVHCLNNSEADDVQGSGSENDAIVCQSLYLTRKNVEHGFAQNGSKRKKKKRPLLSVQPDAMFKLQNINLNIKKGNFVGICGHVGSGKSTLLETILGLLPYDSGNVVLRGKVAYVPQDAWIFNGTLRDNILFGEQLEPVRYYNVLNACCLVNDFGSLGPGDLTVTDDIGSNLSGGQKQRICIARALYQSDTKDIFVLDNPFSGLDDRVANSVYERVITELCGKQKTVVLVTHQLQYLKQCHDILVLSEGQIVEQGTFEDLTRDLDSQFSQLMVASPSSETDTSSLLEDAEMLDTSSLNLSTGSAKSGLPKTPVGSISWGTYWMYLQSAGGPTALALIILIFAVNIGSTAFSTWWLKSWFRSSKVPVQGLNSTNLATEITGSESMLVINAEDPQYFYYRNVYVAIIAVLLLTSFIRTLMFVGTSVRAARALHERVLANLFKSRLKSTEKTGTGDLLQIFSRDMSEIDCGLPHSLEFLLQNICLVFAILVMVSIVFPVFIIPAFLLFGIFLIFRRVYNAAIRDLKRFESSSKTPILTSLSEFISGIGTIRAFGKERQMITKFDTLVDRHNSIFFAFVAAARWLSFRLDVLAVCVVATTALFIVIFHGQISPAACGLALSYAAQLSGVFQVTVRMASELEAKFVSVERVKRYLKTSTPEEPEKLEIVKSPVLHPNWPFSGRLKFDRVTLKYSEKETVLKNISVDIKAGTKVGIVGRTGSGKSSLGCAIFRICELSEGSIYLDDVNIAEVPLETLRNLICVVPQEPAVFQNSVRFNLDPNKCFPDAEIWNAIEKVGLKHSIASLDHEVPLSQGQKQLLAIARAILRHSVLVFVDEATSNVDQDTAAIIDKLIFQEFSESTILVVAHRFEALKYCEYLLVMDDGEIKDYGPVSVVTKNPEFLTYFEHFETVQL